MAARGAWSCVSTVKCSGFACFFFCIRGDLGRVCLKITKALDRHPPPLEPPVLSAFQPSLSFLSLCALESDLWQPSLPLSRRTAFFHFLSQLKTWSHRSPYREEKHQHKTGHQSSGDVNPHCVTLSPFQSLPPRGAGREMWNITLVIPSGHNYVLVTAY